MVAPRRLLASVVSLALLATSACGASPVPATGPAPLVLERTIPLGRVEGRIDHLAIDLKHGRLFVAELSNGTVDVIDLAKGAPLWKIPGLREPQGLAYLPDSDQLVVASGGDGTVRFFGGPDLEPAGLIHLGGDADNVRPDPRTGNVIVGFGAGALAVIDPTTRRLVATLPLPGHPESFRLEGERVFVNVPSAQRIVVGDLVSGRTLASWPTPHLWNFPMAPDPAGKTVSVVFRMRSRLVRFEAATGKVLSDIPTCGDADDLFLDARRQRAYVTCGTGSVDVIGGDHRLALIPTRWGARTSLFVPELDRLYVAARATGGRDAAILVYRPQP